MLQRAWALATREITITASLFSVGLACSGPLKQPFFAPGAASFVGGAITALGAPAPVVSTLVLSSGLYNSCAAVLHRRRAAAAAATAATSATAAAAATSTAAAAASVATAGGSRAIELSPVGLRPGTQRFVAEPQAAAPPAALPRADATPAAAAAAALAATAESVAPLYAPPPPSLALLAVGLKLVGGQHKKKLRAPSHPESSPTSKTSPKKKNTHALLQPSL
jgi:hypothetical protein